MKEYTTKDIAQKLGTSEETVRRWIRSGQLEAKKTSKKNGLVISDSMLKAFVRTKPKYAAAFANPIGGAIAATTLILGDILLKKIQSNNSKDKELINEKEIKRILDEELKESKEKIKENERKIYQLKKEIEEEKQKVKNIQYTIKEVI